MEPIRIFPSEEIFHICNKSIAGFKIFQAPNLAQRFIDTCSYYNNTGIKMCYSRAAQNEITSLPLMTDMQSNIVRVLAYCIMPDHYHLLLKTKLENMLSSYMSRVENSYTRYFNKRSTRKGPLWQSTFRAAYISDNETLLHVHRYIHLNPTTDNLVKCPADWPWSSYKYFISNPYALIQTKEISIQSVEAYKRFVEGHIEYQRKIKYIQRNFLD